jgi:hypothetical protein
MGVYHRNGGVGSELPVPNQVSKALKAANNAAHYHDQQYYSKTYVEKTTKPVFGILVHLFCLLMKESPMLPGAVSGMSVPGERFTLAVRHVRQ